jgi:hypothetical protein
MSSSSRISVAAGVDVWTAILSMCMCWYGECRQQFITMRGYECWSMCHCTSVQVWLLEAAGARIKCVQQRAVCCLLWQDCFGMEACWVGEASSASVPWHVTVEHIRCNKSDQERSVLAAHSVHRLRTEGLARKGFERVQVENKAAQPIHYACVGVDLLQCLCVLYQQACIRQGCMNQTRLATRAACGTTYAEFCVRLRSKVVI